MYIVYRNNKKINKASIFLKLFFTLGFDCSFGNFCLIELSRTDYLVSIFFDTSHDNRMMIFFIKSCFSMLRLIHVSMRMITINMHRGATATCC